MGLTVHYTLYRWRIVGTNTFVHWPMTAEAAKEYASAHGVKLECGPLISTERVENDGELGAPWHSY